MLYRDGTAAEVSLATLILDAPRIRNVAGDLAQQRLPMPRIALAVLYRAYAEEVASGEEACGVWART